MAKVMLMARKVELSAYEKGCALGTVYGVVMDRKFHGNFRGLKQAKKDLKRFAPDVYVRIKDL